MTSGLIDRMGFEEAGLEFGCGGCHGSGGNGSGHGLAYSAMRRPQTSGAAVMSTPSPARAVCSYPSCLHRFSGEFVQRIGCTMGKGTLLDSKSVGER